MSLKFCAVASHCYPPGLTLQQQELTFFRDVKGCLPLLASPGINPDFVRHGGANSKTNPLESLKSQSGLMDSKQLVKIGSLSPVTPRVIDMQVPTTNAVSFSFGIGEQCKRQEKILQFLKFTTAEAERSGRDISFLSDMMQLHPLAIDVSQQLFAPSLFYPNGELDADAEKPFLDFLGDLALSSKFVAQPDSPVLFTRSGAEMKDILSVVAGFYFSKNSLKCTESSMLIPSYSWVYINDADTSRYSINVPAITPLESPEKIKVKPLKKKKNGRRASMERDLYQKNYFHACESLLSLMINQKGSGRTAILSLKKAGPELPELLTQISAGIAGTGIAVLFSVVCKVASGRVPFCAYKLLNASFGFGLVWLSWAMNRLRDSIVDISKSAGKLDWEDEELLIRVDKNMKEIRFRAAALMAVVVLRFA